MNLGSLGSMSSVLSSSEKISDMVLLVDLRIPVSARTNLKFDEIGNHNTADTNQTKIASPTGLIMIPP